ncbi:MAG: hypothetical protein ABIP44_05925 [Pseudoxanthomonas sp.]
MRSAVLLAISMVLAVALAVPARARTISDDTDRISGERTIAYTADGSTDLARPVFTFNAGVNGEVSSSAINLAFVSRDEGGGIPAQRFAGCHSVEWFVDGKPLATAPASHRGRVIDGEMIELIGQSVTTDWVATIGTAQAVRYRVCRDEYALTPGDINAFGVIAAKLKGATLSASSSRTAAPTPTPAGEVRYEGMNWRPQGQGTMFPSRK